MSFAAIMLAGLAIDAAIGWPDRLHARIGHPVTWVGALIAALEARWNEGPRTRRLRRGAAAVALVCAAALLPALALQASLPDGWAGLLIGGLLTWPLIAARSMRAHVVAVAHPLARGDVAGARKAVAMIVGRDPSRLDARGIARAALESLAENTSDGILAPVFWGVVAGLPGIAVYKAVNTLDSMIGHRDARFEAFGKAAARLDDALNWIPARLTGGLFALASGRPGGVWCVMRQDAPRHRSPNAGWPESAMAGALGVRLSGPRLYGDTIADEPWLNGAAPDPGTAELSRGLSLYARSMALLALALLVAALL